jgi:hypothetical protein
MSAGARNNKCGQIEIKMTTMKQQKQKSQLMNTALALWCVALVSGCASSAGYKQADKTGESINTLRNDVVNIKSAVDASMKALDTLEAAATTNPRKPYETFAKSVDKVEDAQQTAQKHAAQMQERGSTYFKEWESQLSNVQSEEIRKLAQERKTKLQETFGNIKTAAKDAKESFPPFLSNLKDLRTALGADLTVQGIDAGKGIFMKTKASGVEVQKHLDILVTELNSVVASITAANQPKP